MWIAVKKQKVQRDGVIIDIEPGDPVPEAASWANRGPWIRRGFIKDVPDQIAVEVSTDTGLGEKPVEESRPVEDDGTIVIAI